VAERNLSHYATMAEATGEGVLDESYKSHRYSLSLKHCVGHNEMVVINVTSRRKWYRFSDLEMQGVHCLSSSRSAHLLPAKTAHRYQHEIRFVPPRVFTIREGTPDHHGVVRLLVWNTSPNRGSLPDELHTIVCSVNLGKRQPDSFALLSNLHPLEAESSAALPAGASAS
jgi:hypothetical protein